MKDIKILFVDDDTEILDIVSQFLSRKNYAITISEKGPEALKWVAEKKTDIVFTDLMMPGMNGLELLKEIKRISPLTEVIIITGYGTIESAIEALKLGGYDYLQKPINFERLNHLIERIAEKKRLQQENSIIKKRLKERYKYDNIVGISPKMQNIYQVIDRISMKSPTVLIQGESGTGKELCANVIHENSDRRDNRFVAVNCGAISEGLLESELFGHVKGAFTGAIRDAMGLFKAADQGTIFLDEIAEIPPSIQVKLLRVLQEKKIRPVGDYKEIEADVRVIAATNKNLKQCIQNKTFRQDLYYRLNVISIHMPPLREIKEDIPYLIDHFLKMNAKKNKKVPLRVSPSAMDILLNYNWPGNVRELENIIERAYALGTSETIWPSDLPFDIEHHKNNVSYAHLNLNLLENEITLIRKALKITDGSRSKAAALLGINQSTVYRKIEKYNIDVGNYDYQELTAKNGV